MMQTDSKTTTESQFAARQIELVKGSDRLVEITEAVDPRYLDQINSIDWLDHPKDLDDHFSNPQFGCRYILTRHELMRDVDQAVSTLIPEINRLCGTDYTMCGSVWHLCTQNFYCPIHTDGNKRNVMIIYWQAPDMHFGTTFYNSVDPRDVFHEFASVPNTGFFAQYEPSADGDCPQMWHASLRKVPKGKYRLLTQYEFYR